MVDIQRFDHIGMVVPELEPQVEFLSGLFGFRQTHSWEDDNARGVLMDVPGDSGVKWELLSPASASSPLQEFIDSPRGPGLHHVAGEVLDVNAANMSLSAIGIEPATSDGRLIIGPDRGGQGFTFQLAGRSNAGPCTGNARDDAAPASDAPSLGITKIDHICHAYPDRDDLAGKFDKLFGMRQIWRTPDGEHDDFADLVLEMPAQMLWEVIMPIGDDSFIQKYLDRRGPCVHHIAFQVADWDKAIAACEHYGVEPFDENSGETDGAAWRDIFIHPKVTGGILVQFFWEEKSGVWIRSDKIRPQGFEG